MTPRRSPGSAIVAAVARALLALHPSSFTRRWGREYLEGAEHRWRLERGRGGWGAPARALWVLVLDAMRSVPSEWRDAWRRQSDVKSLQEAGTEGTMMTWMEGWIWDVRIALRRLSRRPLVSLLVVGTLALGIGSNAVIYGALDRIVLNPLPFEGSDRAVVVMSSDVARGFTFSITQEQYERFRQGARSLERLEAFQPIGGLLVRGDDVEQLSGVGVSIGLADMIHAVPVAGRLFTLEDGEPGAPAVAMLDEEFWRNDFGADLDIIGSTLTISDVERTVVGIWPSRARFRVEQRPDYLVPLERGAEIDRSFFSIGMGLLAEGTDSAAAANELRSLAAGMEEDPSAWSEDTPQPVVLPMHTFVSDTFIQALWILYAGVGLLLLVAGVNSANLLLNRAIDREQELGVRLALGGEGPRLMRQFLIEGATLSALGAMVGVAAASQGAKMLSRVAPSDLQTAALAGDVGNTAAYAAVLVVFLTMVCGLLPALHLRSPAVRSLMGSGRRSEGRRRHLLERALVGGQVALAALVVIGSGLAFRSLVRVNAIDLGFRTDELHVVSLRYSEIRDADDEERVAMASLIRDELAALPGVQDISVSFVLPLSYSIRFGTPYLDGEEPPAGGDGSFSQSASSSAGFLSATGIPLVEGRDFTDDEREMDNPTVVLVNQGFARRYANSVLDRTLYFAGDSIGRRIVGVVGDVRTGDVKDNTIRAQIYYPSNGLTRGRTQRYLVRASGEGIPQAIRARVKQAAPGLLVTDVQSGRQMFAERTDDNRFLAIVLGVLGVLSLTLALGGVYGAVALSVGRRTREMGIRIALGAQPARVTGRVVIEGLRPVVVGLFLGLGVAVVVGRYLADILYEVSPRDPASFALTTVILVGAAALAAFVPARGAARVDPTEALRSD